MDMPMETKWDIQEYLHGQMLGAIHKITEDWGGRYDTDSRHEFEIVTVWHDDKCGNAINFESAIMGSTPYWRSDIVNLFGGEMVVRINTADLSGYKAKFVMEFMIDTDTGELSR